MRHVIKLLFMLASMSVFAFPSIFVSGQCLRLPMFVFVFASIFVFACESMFLINFNIMLMVWKHIEQVETDFHVSRLW